MPVYQKGYSTIQGSQLATKLLAYKAKGYAYYNKQYSINYDDLKELTKFDYALLESV